MDFVLFYLCFSFFGVVFQFSLSFFVLFLCCFFIRVELKYRFTLRRELRPLLLGATWTGSALL